MKNYENKSLDHLSKEEIQNEGNTDEVRRCQHKVVQNIPTPEDMEDNPLWDGSESEIVPDDDVLIYEEQQPGIKLEYSLKYEEVLSCLKLISGSKVKGRGIVIKTVIMALLGVVFLVLYTTSYNLANLILAAISISFAIAINVVPNIIMQNTAREIAPKEHMYVEIYPDNLVIGKNGVEREIPLDGTSEFQEFENLFIVIPEKGEMLAIPIRTIEPDVLADVQAILTAGTEPRSN
mgnify:CR=1 FL=1